MELPVIPGRLLNKNELTFNLCDNYVTESVRVTTESKIHLNLKVIPNDSKF